MKLKQTGFVHISLIDNNMWFVTMYRLIMHGVPQGSVLGLWLFCLLFNPIAHSFIDNKPSLYADDTEAHCSHSDLDVKRVDQWLAMQEQDDTKPSKRQKNKIYGHRIASSSKKGKKRLESTWMRFLSKSLHSTILEFALVIYIHGIIM